MKKKSIKRLTALIMAVCMTLGLTVFTMSANEPEDTVYSSGNIIYSVSTEQDYRKVVESPWHFGPGWWGDTAWTVSTDVRNNTTASMCGPGNSGWGTGMSFPIGDLIAYGGEYTISLWSYAPSGNVNFLFGFDGNGGLSASWHTVTATNSWQKSEFTFTFNGPVPGTVLSMGNTSGGPLFYVDDIRIYENSRPEPTPSPIIPDIGSPIDVSPMAGTPVYNFDFTNVQFWGWGHAPSYDVYNKVSPALRIDANGAWSAGLSDNRLAEAIEPNTSYILRGVYRADKVFNFDFGVQVSGNFNMVSLTTSNNWKYAQHIFTTPGLIDGARLYISSAQSNASTYYVSDMELLELAVRDVFVAKMPNTVLYDTGQPLNLNGMILSVGYQDVEYTANIPLTLGMSGLTVSGYNAYAPGVQTLSFNYKGIPFSINVEVMEGGLDAVGIAQLTHPAKTHYWLGEQFDFTGLRFFHQFRNGSYSVITATADMVDASSFNANVAGSYPIYVNYDGFSYSFNVKVSERNNFTITPEGRILDPNGDDFISIGVNVNGNGMWGFDHRSVRTDQVWINDPNISLRDVDLLADTWGFNTVRVVCTFSFAHPAVWNRHWHYDDIDAIVEAFTNKGVVVMLEMHDPIDYGYPAQWYGLIPSGDAYRVNLAEFTASWLELANKHKDNPYVWFNLYNEPGYDGNYIRLTELEEVNKWYEVHNSIIKAFRDDGIENIIVLDENAGGRSNYRMSDPYGIGSPCIYWGPTLNAQYDNILYSLHPYYWTSLERMFSYADTMRELGLAWIMGEYGAIWGDVPNHIASMIVYEIGLTRGIGRLYWDWSNDSMAVVNRDLPGIRGGWGYEINRIDGTKPTNLSWFGELVWADGKGTLTLPIKRFVFPIVVNGDFRDGTVEPWHNFGGGLRLMQGMSHDLSDCAQLMAGSDYTGQTLDYVNLEAGVTYRFSAWGRSGGNIGNQEIGFCFTAPAQGHNDNHFATLTFTSTEWTYKEVIFTLPADIVITDARLFVWRANSSAGFFFDKVSIVPIDAPNPCEKCEKCDICGKCVCDVPTCKCERCEGHKSGFSINLGAEKAGGAGFVRDIAITGGALEGKFILARVINGAGESTSITVMLISAMEYASVSYSRPNAVVDVWLTDGMPDLTGGNLGVIVYCTAN